LAVYDLIRKLLPQAIVFLAGDDTLLNRRGLKMFGVGMHRDPLLSSRGFTVVRWGHCWVVLCVVIGCVAGKRAANSRTLFCVADLGSIVSQ